MNHLIIPLIVAVLFVTLNSAFAQDAPVCPLGADWTFNAQFSDEFNQSQLDSEKWFDTNPTWLGRQPAKFCKENVYVKDGKLCLRADVAPEGYYSEADKQKGFHTFRTAAVKSKNTVLYGYFEVRSKPMNSTASSSFWFYDSTPEIWTEIDVYEMSGKHPHYGNLYLMNAHVMYTPTIKEHFAKAENWKFPFHPADDFHVYALEWTKDHLKWYVDGQCVRELKNEYWHQPLTINFDSETMPDWFGLPDPKDLPSVFEIDYIRVWQKK